MNIFTLLGTIAVNNDAANQALDDTAAKADQTNQRMSDAFGKIGRGAAVLGRAVVSAGAVIGGAWIAAIEGTREYRTQLGMLDTAFQVAGLSTEQARQTFSALNAVLGDSAQATEASQHIAQLADNEKELQTWTDICTGVFATFGEALPVEGLVEAANETAKVGTVTGGLADALNWAGISEDEFNEKLAKCSTEQQRQDLIMTTLNGTYQKAATQYKETNKDVLAANRAQEKLTNAMAELGRVGEPILTAIKDKAADMAAAAVPKIEKLIKAVKDARKWMKENENTVDAWKAAIIGATVSVGTFVLVLKWSAIMTAAKNAIAGVRAAILLFNAALRANPIGLVVSLLAGLVAAFVYLWNNNKSFRAFWLDMWAKIKSATGSAVSWVKGKFSDLKGAVQTVKNTFGNIRDAIGDSLDKARAKVKSAIDKIRGFFPLSIGKIFSNLKIPKISVSGGQAPFGIAGRGKLPSFNVRWNAEGAVFKRATILDTRMGYQGVGEAGQEAVAPIDVLQDYVAAAVRSETGSLGRIMVEQTQLLMAFLQDIMPQGVRLDTGALVGALTPAVDARLAQAWSYKQRGM